MLFKSTWKAYEMTQMKAFVSVFFGGSLLFGLLASCGGIDPETRLDGTPVLSPRTQAETRTHIDFVQHVKPIIEQRCVWCHNGKDKEINYSLLNRSGAFAKQRIVPGKPSKSLFYLAAGGDHPGLEMPAVGMKIAPSDHAVLRRWIESGAVWPDGPAGQLQGR
jgi:hypothetical protein